MSAAGIYKRIVARYKDLPFQRRLLLNFAALLLICLVVLYIILAVSLSSIRASELALISKLNSQAVEQMQSHLLELENLTKQPLYDNALMMMFNSYALGKIQPDQELMIQTLNKIMKSNTHMQSAFFFNTKGDLLSYIINNGFILSPYRPSDQEWFSRTVSLRGQALVTGSIRVPDAHFTEAGSAGSFAVTRAMVDAESGRVLAVLALFPDIRILRGICANTAAVTGERVLLLDSRHLIVYDTQEININRSLTDSDLAYLVQDRRLGLGPAASQAAGTESTPETSLTPGGSLTTAAGGAPVRVITLPVGESGWLLVRVIPEAQLNQNIRGLENKITLMLIGFMLLFLTVAILMSFEVTKPIKKLIQIMNLTEKGDLSVRFKPRHNDEIAQLGNSFNRMLNEINKLIASIYDIERQKRETELNALQMQINPHFIYNTLESIRMMAKINHDEESSEMIFILSKMLRYSISTKAARVPLRSEITNLRHYMTLQNLRFDNKFVLNIQVEPELEEMPIIKQILQPIVENAVYHALELTDTPGCIWLRAARDSAGVSLEIEDNGMGMSPESLDSLNEKINREDGPEQASRGIGLKNINQRIRLFYGSDYGIQVTSQVGQGTRVLVRLPEPEWVPAAENSPAGPTDGPDNPREV